jgi:UDP-glucose 4-epimerase
MKVLVTGGGGYVGSVAIEKLINQNHDVVVIDNLINGHRSAMLDAAEWIECDLRDGDGIFKAIASTKPDAVMHFAALTIVPESIARPQDYYGVNTIGSYNLLSAMVKHEVENLVLSSTAAVYGKPLRSPVREEDPTIPISPYGTSKLVVEQMSTDFSKAYGLNFVALRYFNVAGATYDHGEDHNPETHLIPSAIFAAMGRRDPLLLFGTDYDTPDGTAVRDYIHVVDLVEAHIAALDQPGKINGALNLGAGKGTSVAEILDAVERVSGQKVPVIKEGRRPGDPPQLVASISQAESKLDWQPRNSNIDEIVESAWSWHERFPDGYALP